jgi:hypothetical protein
MALTAFRARGDLARAFTIAFQAASVAAMIEIVRTNDPVLISFVEALMRDAGIGFMVADQNMSILEGSIGVLPRRVLVAEDEAAQARRILVDAGIADELRPS